MTDQATCRIRWESGRVVAELDGEDKPLQVVCRSRPADLVEWLPRLSIFLNFKQRKFVGPPRREGAELVVGTAPLE